MNNIETDKGTKQIVISKALLATDGSGDAAHGSGGDLDDIAIQRDDVRNIESGDLQSREGKMKKRTKRETSLLSSKIYSRQMCHQASEVE
jgi:hypothetical protein